MTPEPGISDEVATLRAERDFLANQLLNVMWADDREREPYDLWELFALEICCESTEPLDVDDGQDFYVPFYESRYRGWIDSAPPRFREPLEALLAAGRAAYEQDRETADARGAASGWCTPYSVEDMLQLARQFANTFQEPPADLS
jgi:hypothetical protein